MRKILLVIDMQNDFIDGILGTPEAAAVVDHAVEGIKKYPARDIIATRDTHGENYLDTQSGYYRSDWNTSDQTKNQELADFHNQELGVTEAQRKAMEAGSMFGWSCPGADPKTYEQTADQPQMGGMNLG